jgi:hypothetical protein
LAVCCTDKPTILRAGQTLTVFLVFSRIFNELTQPFGRDRQALPKSL